MIVTDKVKEIGNKFFLSPGNEIQLGSVLEALELLVTEGLVAYDSDAGAGGAATEVMSVPGLAAGDTILAVSQVTPGANDLPLLGFSTQGDGVLTGIWSADPDAGSVIRVLVKKAA